MKRNEEVYVSYMMCVAGQSIEIVREEALVLDSDNYIKLAILICSRKPCIKK
jgi:hypothetical protein